MQETVVQTAVETTNWWQTGWEFATSPAGLVAIGLFVAYLFLWRFLGWTASILKLGLGKLANIYLFTLAITVGGVVVYSIGSSWQHGTDPLYAAMTSGGIAATVWGMLVLVLYRVFGDGDHDDDETPAKKVKKK